MKSKSEAIESGKFTISFRSQDNVMERNKSRHLDFFRVEKSGIVYEREAMNTLRSMFAGKCSITFVLEVEVRSTPPASQDRINDSLGEIRYNMPDYLHKYLQVSSQMQIDQVIVLHPNKNNKQLAISDSAGGHLKFQLPCIILVEATVAGDIHSLTFKFLQLLKDATALQARPDLILSNFSRWNNYKDFNKDKLIEMFT